MPYEPSHEEKHLAELSEKYRDRLIEQAQELEQRYKDSATSDRDKESIDSFLNLRQQLAEDYRRYIRNNDPIIRDINIVDAINRYGKAAAQHFHREAPFESLAATCRADFDTFTSEQSALAEKISSISDPKEREILKTAKLIEAYEYLARAAGIISNQSEHIAGHIDNPESRRMEHAAKRSHNSIGYSTRASDLRQQYRQMQTERTVPAKEQAQPQSALEQIVVDAKSQTPSSPPQKQQELERQAQKDRDRER